MNRRQTRGRGGWLREQYNRRPKPLWMVIVADLLVFGIALVVFALFHHVLPRHEQSVGLVSSRDSAGDDVIAVNDLDAREASEGDGEAEVDLSSLTGEDLSFSEDGEYEEDDEDDQEAAEVEAEAEAPAAEPKGATLGFVGDLTAEAAGDFGAKFADKFTTGKVKRSSSGYRSANVNISLKRYSRSDLVFYVADIYIRDISSFVTAFANDTFGAGQRERALPMSQRVGAILSINGDYYGARTDGIVIRNGELYRTDPYPDRDVCVLFWDGRMETYGTSKFNAEAAINNGAYQAWNFGPRLLDDNGKAKTRFNSDVGPANPRTALGYFEPGHYCFVVVDGRSDDSGGMTLTELAALMQELGCVRAYNMDGGNTSVMTAGGKLVNQPSSGGRETSDIIAIIEPW